MSKIRINFDKGLNMHLVCGIDELRPAMCNIYFKNGFAYATNANILVRNKLSECSTFSEEQINLLDGKMIHKNTYKEILKFQIVTIRNDGIETIEDGQRIKYFFSNTPEEKFPNCQKVIDDLISKKDEPIDKIGLKINLLYLIQQAMPNCFGHAIILKGKRNGAVIRDSELRNESMGIIMPVLISED